MFNLEFVQEDARFCNISCFPEEFPHCFLSSPHNLISCLHVYLYMHYNFSPSLFQNFEILISLKAASVYSGFFHFIALLEISVDLDPRSTLKVEIESFS